MAGIVWRVVIAVIAVLFAFAIVPLVADIFGLSLAGSVWKLLKLCIAAIAVFYILRGGTPLFARP